MFWEQALIFLTALPPTSDTPAYGVLSRILGSSSAKRFHFTKVSGTGEHCTVQAKDGEVDIAGTSSVAMCRGAYEYLKSKCHCQVSWSGDNVKLPRTLPDTPPFEVGTANRYRHYFNVCTFGYTTVWWDWKRWQHEIDWMALHGINMPLAMNGQEAIWQKLFLGLGLPRKSLDRFFTGPAFLPWHRMGNVDGHMGPLSQRWIDGQAELQKKILARERGLGMTPVVPGFSGFVPTDFQKIHREVKLESPSDWGGFAATTFISPLDPMFTKIGTQFIRAYNRQFGSDHLYLCDTFNEMDPQFPASEEIADLGATGKAVYDSIHAADPDGIWVTQGWLFYNARSYWNNERTAALLGSVPEGKLVVLDLATNEHEVWRDQPAVRDGGWIYNTLHNYGQTTNLYGDLQRFLEVAQRAAADPKHGRMLGMGLTPEGIDQNPIVYELMTDIMWHPELKDVREWLPDYTASRYGASSAPANQAWTLLLRALYGPGGGYRDPWRYRPTIDISLPSYDIDKVRHASELLLECDGLADNSLYRRDLVDVTKTWIGGLADVYLAAALASFDQDKSRYRIYKEKFMTALHDLDRIMATRPEHRLSTWINSARAWGSDNFEKVRLEQNARMQVTVWGGPELFDYANKEWAGLNQDFIRRRWELFFAALEKSKSVSSAKLPDYPKWELDWASSTAPIRESRSEDSVKLAQELFLKYKDAEPNVEKLLGLDSNLGIAVGKPVIDSGGTEPGHNPDVITDGQTFGQYWAASPAPQWVQIDLLTVQPIDTVWLFPYFGDGRSYQYRIDVSTDGKLWTRVVDASSNIRVSTFEGYREQFRKTSARYIKVTMLHNSSNIGVHLYEVRVF